MPRTCQFCPKELRADNKSGACQKHKGLLISQRSYQLKHYYKNRDKLLEQYRSYRKERIDFLKSLKLTLGCIDCGYRDHAAALDFDHVSEGKVENVGRMGSSSWSKILEEIDKCEVVCANCHRIRTETRRENSRPSRAE